MASSRNIWHKPPVIRDRGSANHHTPGRDPATRTTNIINPYPSGGVPPPWEGDGTERSTGRMMYFSQAEQRARRLKDLSSTKGVHRRNRGSDNSRSATDRRTSTNDRAIPPPKTKHTNTPTYTRNTGPPDVHYTATITWTDIQSQLAQKTRTPDTIA